MTITIGGRTVALILAVAVLLLGGGYWLMRSNGVASEYTDALVECARDSQVGAARIRALQLQYGEDSAPDELSLKVSMCSLDASVKDLKALGG